MIIEMRTYTLKPGNIPTFEERFGGALAIRAEILEARRFLAYRGRPAEPGDPCLAVRQSSISAPAFAPRPRRRKAGRRTRANSRSTSAARSSCRRRSPRRSSRASLAASTRSACTPTRLDASRGDGALGREGPERIELSPLVGAWHSEFGGLNKWRHIWAYKDAGERSRIRAEAVAKGVWPPGGPPGALLKQENMLVGRPHSRR